MSWHYRQFLAFRRALGPMDSAVPRGVSLSACGSGSGPPYSVKRLLVVTAAEFDRRLMLYWGDQYTYYHDYLGWFI